MLNLKMLRRVVLGLLAIISATSCALSPIIKGVEERKDLESLLIDLVTTLSRHHDVSCVAVVCDATHLHVFEGALFRRAARVSLVMIVVEEYEDLLSPNWGTLEGLRRARADGCGAYLVLLANGLQAARLLRFGDRHRILDTRAKYIMLHDFRLFHSELHYLWKRIVNVVFLRYHRRVAAAGTAPAKGKPWFDLTTVPFPNPIKAIFVSRRVDIWRNGRFHYNRPLFADKTNNLNQEVLKVVYLDHVPSVVVVKNNDTNKIGGVEIEILHTLAEKMNFKPNLYQSVNAEYHKWGQKQANGSFSGLIGEILGGADVALGNLQYTPYHLQLMDLSIPYTAQCWTFLTPEALTDNSWKTLILPFKLYMWVAVLLVLLVTGAIFHGLARAYQHLLRHQAQGTLLAEKSQDSDEKPVGLYLFGEVINSILYTYGMLVVVSLPRLPSGWAVRLLTGWYWLYCVLLVVSYRASMTAILANPAPRVTIDTLQELVYSRLPCGGWGAETRRFFTESLDDVGQKIGERFQTVDEPDEAAARVARGAFAYYENEYFLKYLSVKRKNWNVTMDTQNSTNSSSVKTGERELHIMSHCVVNVPVSLGFHKNSPLKPRADTYLRRVVEVGLLGKWLADAMHPLRKLDSFDDEVKALMNLKKLYGAFVALAIGYFLSFLCLSGELIYWNCVVKKDPRFDKYAMDVYYMKKK